MTDTIRGNRHKLLVERLVELRKAAGVTQVELADMLQVYQSHIARLESGQRHVDVIEFLDLAKALDFDAEQVLKEIETQAD